MKKYLLPSLLVALLSLSCSDESSTPGSLDFPEELEPSKDAPKDSSKEGALVTILAGSVQGESLKEASAVLFELDKNLVQTGTAMMGMLDSKDHYSVSTTGFTSPYAELIVSGKSVQPCSGKEVDSKISVIVDLSKDSTVNLNLFSYFFSERLKELVKNSNMEILKAWEQAEKEVRTLFALPEGDVALEAFAASALMDRLGERAIAKSAPQWRSELAETFSHGGDFTKNDTIRVIGGVALFYDISAGELDWCRDIKNKVFEKKAVQAYMHTLWLSILDAEECTEERQGEIHPVFDPKKSLTYVQESFPVYKCDSGAWHYAFGYERMNVTDTAGRVDGDYLRREGYSYVYDEVTGWRYADPSEDQYKSGCTKSREGIYLSTAVCMGGSWVSVPESTSDTQGLECVADDSLVYGRFTHAAYVCEGGSFYKVTEMDEKLGRYCTKKTLGDTAYAGLTPFLCRDDWTLIPPDSLDEWLKDSRDGNSYPIVRMGSQRWMGANLKYVDSTASPNLAGNLWRPAFYSWTAAMDLPEGTDPATYEFTLPHRGICPEGWHMPTKAEWDSLFAFAKEFGPQGKLAHSLMGGISWGVVSDAMKPLDTFGFNVVATGRRELDGAYKNDASHAYFWFVTQEENKYQYYYLWNSKEDVFVGKSAGPDLGISVRCVEDSK